MRFCLEGMEESGSEGLDELIFSRKDTFFKDVDFVCISDNYWLGKKKPCITYGLRGICYFFIEVSCRRLRVLWCVFQPIVSLVRRGPGDRSQKGGHMCDGGAQSLLGVLVVNVAQLCGSPGVDGLRSPCHTACSWGCLEDRLRAVGEG